MSTLQRSSCRATRAAAWACIVALAGFLVADDCLAGDIKVDAGKKVGTIRRINGGNGGPICYGGLVDLTEHHRQLRIPINRTHDPNWPGGKEVDIHTIFPNFDADPELPSSYFFGPTDDYILSLVAVGQDILYRLGESIEHTPRKFWVKKPSDYEKWAKICIGIIRHYNEGWANGFNLNIKYWEIWNEPELGKPMWDSTIPEYIELYVTAAKAIKARFPNLKVGGPGAVGIGAPPHPGALHKPIEMLLDRCKKDNVPIDFVSWHCYTIIPNLQLAAAKGMRELLDKKYEMPNTELHLDEWNYLGDGWGPVLSKGGESFERFVANIGNEASAAYAMCFLLAMEDSPVDMTYFYTIDNGCFGMFSTFGVPKKTYHAFLAFRDLADHSQRLALRGNVSGELEAVAGMGEKDTSIALMVSAFQQPGVDPNLIKVKDPKTKITIENIPWDGPSELEIKLINKELSLGSVLKETREGKTIEFVQDLPAPTVMFVTVKKPLPGRKEQSEGSFGKADAPVRCKDCGQNLPKAKDDKPALGADEAK